MDDGNNSMNGVNVLDFRKRKIASTLTFLGGCFVATDI